MKCLKNLMDRGEGIWMFQQWSLLLVLGQIFGWFLYDDVYNNNYYFEMANINAWTVLTHPPHELLGQENQQVQGFFEMLKNLLAPYYKFQSITTLLISISFVLYITLVVPYPPFLKIPTFALESLIVLPEYLKHYEFYRLFTAPFIYQDITTLILGMLLIWCLGSFTEETMGWKMLIVVSGFSGLVGYSNSFTLPILLIGCNFSFTIMKWADPNMPILYRKVMLVIYTISIAIFILFLINYNRQQQFNFYSSFLYGFLFASILGRSQDGSNLTTFRKLLASSSIITLLAINIVLLTNIIYNNKTFI